MKLGLLILILAIFVSSFPTLSHAEPPADQAWEALTKDLPNGRESLALELRRRGLEFWQRFPDDPRRYTWLFWTLGGWGTPPRYCKDTKAADEAWDSADYNTLYGLPIDQQKKTLWEKQYACLKNEVLNDPSFSNDQRMGIVGMELQSRLMTTRNEVHYQDKVVNDQALWGEVLDFAKQYPRGRTQELLKIFRDYPQDFGLESPQKMLAMLEPFEQIPNDTLRDFVSGLERLARLSETPLDLRFTAIDGRKIDIKDYRGKIVFIDIWSTG